MSGKEAKVSLLQRRISLVYAYYMIKKMEYAAAVAKRELSPVSDATSTSPSLLFSSSPATSTSSLCDSICESGSSNEAELCEQRLTDVVRAQAELYDSVEELNQLRADWGRCAAHSTHAHAHPHCLAGKHANTLSFSLRYI